MPGMPPHPLSRWPSTSAGPGGIGTAFSSLEWPCYFRMGFVSSSRVLGCCRPLFFLPFLPFPPGGQGGNHRVAVSVVGRSATLFTRRLGSYPSPASLLSFPGTAVLVGFNFGLWNRLCWGHDAPVGRITSWRRVLVLVPSCLLPASSLPQFHQSCCSLETSLYVPGRGQVACRWGIDRARRLVPHVSTTAARGSHHLCLSPGIAHIARGK